MVTPELVRDLFSYDRDKGNLVWKKRITNAVNVGDVAGSKDKHGRLIIGINYKVYFAHRLIWLYLYGSWPTHEIDHIDGNPSNNKIDNLRDVPRTINQQNMRKAWKNNKTGMLGVHFDKREYLKKRYSASIRANGKSIRLGYFKTADEAHSAYLEAKRKLHDGCII